MLLLAILLVDFKVPFSFIEMMAEGGSSIVFDSSDPTIKNDLNVIIHQYLVEQQFISAANAIQSELSQRNIDAITKRLLAYDATTLISKSRDASLLYDVNFGIFLRSQIVLMRNLLCRGEWDEAHQLLAKLVPRSDIRRFLYHFNKLEFLEFIETSQHLQALAFLQVDRKEEKYTLTMRGKRFTDMLLYFFYFDNLIPSVTLVNSLLSH